MAIPDGKRLVPYEMVAPGVEAVYTGETSAEPIHEPEWPISRFTDADGNVCEQWPTWTWCEPPEDGDDWGDPEINCINAMQRELGPLDDETRKLRAHLGSLVICDNGFPVSLDQILEAIGAGALPDTPFHAGCFMGGVFYDTRTTQPHHTDSMRAIQTVLTEYMAGAARQDLVDRFPHAAGFIERCFDWLGPSDQLTDLHRLMMKRMLLPFEFFTGENEDYEHGNANCFEPGGRGAALDARIAEMAGLPPIYRVHQREFREHRAAIDDLAKRALYENCCHIASGVHGLSHCHHATFHRIEYWIYGIGAGVSPDSAEPVIPTRPMGAERERLGRLLFGYVLGLDKWLVGRPMEFLLLDVAHLDLGLDPRTEVSRVYAYLGAERTPVKQWLAACAWYNLAYHHLCGNPAGLFAHRHKHLVERAEQLGLSLREWMDSALAGTAAALGAKDAPGIPATAAHPKRRKSPQETPAQPPEARF